MNNDPYQFNNLLLNDNIPDDFKILQNILDKWILDTGDTLPENLTKDWYLREQEPFNQSSLLKTEYNGIRGEMPGASSNAVRINNKGPF